jgi:microsomal dipeptidase-like Zn-dependent dipeptidase
MNHTTTLTLLLALEVKLLGSTALVKRGHKAAAIDKLLGGNWYRLLRDVLG